MLKSSTSVLAVIDVQERLVSALTAENQEIITNKAAKIVNAANILKIDTIVTEQYPKGLGQTITAVKDVLGESYKPFEKTYFSIIKEPEIYEAIKKTGKKQVVLFGIEAHICVFQTALHLKEEGFEVFVVQDISYSRSNFEKEAAMQNLRHLNIQTPTLENVLFMWLEGAKNPDFKAVQALIK